MQLKRTLISLYWITSAAVAQTQPAAPAAGPTVQESIAFISDLYAKQGPIQTSFTDDPSILVTESRSLRLESECSLVVKMTLKIDSRSSNDFTGVTSVLHLARSEPNSVSIRTQLAQSPVLYQLFIEHAYSEIRSVLDAIDDSAAVSLAPGTEASGRVQSNAGSSILFVSDGGRLMIYTPDKAAKLESGAEDGKTKAKRVTASDFTPGDLISITLNALF